MACRRSGVRAPVAPPSLTDQVPNTRMTGLAQLPLGPVPTLRRAERRLVGRSTELEAIAEALSASRGRLIAVSLEGEPGIGKSTLLTATADMAVDAGMIPVIAAADEELRGPLLFARELFASDSLRDAARDAGELDGLDEMARSITSCGGDDEGMTRDERLLRLLYQVSIA